MVTRLVLIAVTMAVAWHRHMSALDVWLQWDSKWYVGIATHGYHWRLHSYLPPESSLAFFPLFPALLHLTILLHLPPVLAGILLSNLAFAGALVYAYLLFRACWGDDGARKAVWLLACLPTAFFAFAPYSESIFLLSATGALYHARRQEGIRSGLWTGAAILTRSTGFILVPCIILCLGPKRLQSWSVGVGSAVCSIGAYLTYLASQHIDLGGLLTTQRAWHRGFTYPWTGFVQSILWPLRHPQANPGWIIEDVGQLSITLAFLVLTAWAWRDLSPALRVYCVGFWLLVLLSPQWLDHYYAPFSSMDRFVLALFPLAGWIGSKLARSAFRTVTASMTLLLATAASVHLAGGWVG